MSNAEIDPLEYEGEHVTCADAIEIITAREVPLGGPRAMKVRRTLPQRRRSLIGPWCFVDHFGPDAVASSGGMSVPRHPHTGLATVTLLFEGRIEHIDSTDFANVVRPAEVNLMIAGTGVSHSEFSSADTTTLHGVQLWYALPDAVRHSAPGSQHHVAERAEVPGGAVMTYIGTCAGITSPVRTRVDALAAQVDVRAGESVELEVDTDFEHGVLVDSGDLTLVVDGHRQPVAPTELAHLPEDGPGTIRLEAGDEPVRAILVGGRPFGEQIVMWWNFVGRSHDEIVAHREAWQTEIGAEQFPGAVSAAESGSYGAGIGYPQFGTFPPNQPAPLPAPALPNARIRPRGQ
ncbi:pirin family protein [Janibacter cremeus]|uniref:pirin family protein n=1 Tax=Janibacter cremeus TaxID=1285192 RepID=UPI0023F9BAF9|nr:pirin family protein [Janibacter cremeus]WEV78597.1 pirin family protein [Janibacter cremeus]